jgi:hypothetical protein
MRKLVFAKSINGTEETGLIDISKNPPEIFCLCDKDKSDEILAGFKKLPDSEVPGLKGIPSSQEIYVFGRRIDINPIGFVMEVEVASKKDGDVVNIIGRSQNGSMFQTPVNVVKEYNKTPQEFILEFHRQCHQAWKKTWTGPKINSDQD